MKTLLTTAVGLGLAVVAAAGAVSADEPTEPMRDPATTTTAQVPEHDGGSVRMQF